VYGIVFPWLIPTDIDVIPSLGKGVLEDADTRAIIQFCLTEAEIPNLF